MSTDSRSADSRCADSRCADSRSADSRGADSRSADGGTADGSGRPTSAAVAAVEIGGSGVQTTLFAADGSVVAVVEGAVQPAGARLAIAVPGVVQGRRVLGAANLGWWDVDPVERLGLRGPAEVVANDALSAARGEAHLRGVDDLLYLGLGTGVGGVLLTGGHAAADEIGHLGGFSGRPCPCGRTGCLETVAAGWALPSVLGDDDLRALADHLAAAVVRIAASSLVVLGGGLTRAHPALVPLVAARVARPVEASRAPRSSKSAAPWGLLASLEVSQP